MRPYFSSLSEDPKGFDAGDYNLFRYCKNDPEDLTDPSGLFVLSGAPWLLQSNSGYEMDKMRPTLLVSAGSGAAEDKPIGNWQDGKLANHVVADKSLGGKGAVTRTGVAMAPQNNGSPQPRLFINWFVENQYKHTDVVTRELQHVDRFVSWIIDGEGHDALTAARRKNLSPTETYNKLEHARAIEFKAQYDDWDASRKSHDLKFFPPIPTTQEKLEWAVKNSTF